MPNLVFADATGRIVTAGGATSWHDLPIHIVARHCSPGEALRLAKVYLLKWHGEGQLPEAAPFEEIAAETGDENPAFFRRLFKRQTGLTPGADRRMFRPFARANAAEEDAP